MYLNKDQVIGDISSFLADKINRSSQKNFLCIYKGSVTDWLSIKLCEEARLTCGADIYFTNISNSPEPLGFRFGKQICFPRELFRDEVIRFSDDSECLIISSLTINSGKYYKNFNKHKHIADLYPLLDLYYSECIELVQHLEMSNTLLKQCLDRDLKLLFNSSEYEYCFKEDLKNSILSDEKSPIKHTEWFKYTKPQKELIAKLHQRYKATLHKDLISSVPYPNIR